jgi:hypothetical protein
MVTSGLDSDVLQRAERVIDLTGKMGDTSVTRAVAIELVEEVKRLRAVVDLVRKLDGNSYPIAPQTEGRQSVAQSILADLRRAVATTPGECEDWPTRTKGARK